MNEFCSYRINHHHIFRTRGLGFYIENDSYTKQSTEREETCHHKRLWKRDEGWTQCIECFKITEVTRSLQKQFRYFRADKVRKKTNSTKQYFHITKPINLEPIIKSIEVDIEEKSFKEKIEEASSKILNIPMPAVDVFGKPHSVISIIPTLTEDKI